MEDDAPPIRADIEYHSRSRGISHGGLPPKAMLAGTWWRPCLDVFDLSVFLVQNMKSQPALVQVMNVLGSGK